MPIRLKIEPGFVQSLVRLDGLNSIMIRRKKSSSVNEEEVSIIFAERLISGLRINNFSNLNLSQKELKKEVNISQSDLGKNLWIDSPAFSFKLSFSQVNILVSQELPFAKGRRVERMGRHGWRGTITAIEDEMAFVNWGFCRTRISIAELYPLDSRDNPYFIPKNPNLIEIARRARTSLRLSTSEAPPESSQGTLLE
jgi:hypothetical protein